MGAGSGHEDTQGLGVYVCAENAIYLHILRAEVIAISYECL